MLGGHKLFDIAGPLHDGDEREQLAAEFDKCYRYVHLLRGRGAHFFRAPPTKLIRDYFGPKHAFYFGFMHHYTAYLHSISLIALAQVCT